MFCCPHQNNPQFPLALAMWRLRSTPTPLLFVIGGLRFPPPALCRLATMPEPRMSAATLKVLGALLSNPRDELSGAEIARIAKLASGTLYPILLRLEDAGWLTSRWENGDPHELGRPRRRFYRVTGLGANRAKAAIRELRPLLVDPAWA
jgi:PadR family transcriptional regulator PadR